MYLKSLVRRLQPFCRPQRAHAGAGITAVVGPNGSGVEHLGRCSVGARRAQRQEPARPGHGGRHLLARRARPPVSLRSISCSTIPTARCRWISGRGAITRRMYCNGESDISSTAPWPGAWTLDILHDSGPGHRHHSIISQGSLGSILQSKPMDRRALIEEAAGGFGLAKRRKASGSWRTWTSTFARPRCGGEVARQLGPPERKAKKARTHQVAAQCYTR